MAEQKTERRQEILATIAAEIVPDEATGAVGYRALVVEGIERYIARQVEAPTDYEASTEENVRNAARAIAKRLRTAADDIERSAGRDDVEKIPQEVTSLVAWGVANAQLDGPARWLYELQLLRRLRAEGKI